MSKMLSLLPLVALFGATGCNDTSRPASIGNEAEQTADALERKADNLEAMAEAAANDTAATMLDGAADNLDMQADNLRNATIESAEYR